MANICISSFKITGDKDELTSLFNLMNRISSEKASTWVGYIVEELNNNEIPNQLYVRGWWSNLTMEDNCISFALESAWSPLTEAWDFICGNYETLSCYFSAEEPGCEIFTKRNHETFNWFPDNYFLDICPPKGECCSDYFETIDEAFKYAEKLSDTNIITAEDIEFLNLKWQDEDENSYIYLHEFTEE